MYDNCYVVLVPRRNSEHLEGLFFPLRNKAESLSAMPCSVHSVLPLVFQLHSGPNASPFQNRTNSKGDRNAKGLSPNVSAVVLRMDVAILGLLACFPRESRTRLRTIPSYAM